MLDFALRGLNDKARVALRIVVLCRMPARYDLLTALLAGEGAMCANEGELDRVLVELEDRGLVGWDKRANRYDLHPVVRGVVYSGMSEEARRATYTCLRAFHDNVLEERRSKAWWHGAVVAQDPVVLDLNMRFARLGNFENAVESYSALVGLGQYDDALDVYDKWLIYKESVARQKIELLGMLFPDGPERPPRLNWPSHSGFVYNELARAHQMSGQPRRAAELYRRANAVHLESNNVDDLAVCLGNLSKAAQLSGALYEAEAAAREAVLAARQIEEGMFVDYMEKKEYVEAVSLYQLGLALATRGVEAESGAALRQSLRMLVNNNTEHAILSHSHLAKRAMWFGELGAALSFANGAWKNAEYWYIPRQITIAAAITQGEASLESDDFVTADKRLNYALAQAREKDYVGEELNALISLAELRRRQGDLTAARELLEDVWEAAERGPYPVLGADAFNVLANVERDAGDYAGAVKAAGSAYRLAWCDGPPFAYHWGLAAARQHLRGLGAPEPRMPPFRAADFEPMSELEIDPGPGPQTAS